MEQINNYNDYLKLLDEIKKLDSRPKLLIHACCAPCSSEVLNELKEYFEITVYYYNPNIYPLEEYEKRYDEFSKLPYEYDLIKGEYDESIYDKAVEGLENLGEFSTRCYKCFEFRLEESARYAKENGYDYFTTTLSISPYKKSTWINEIGNRLALKYNINYLYSDFKKKEGYKKSIELSKKYNLYRQHYCGCKYSKMECE